MTDRIFRVVATASMSAKRPIRCEVSDGSRAFLMTPGQTLDVTEELGPDIIDPADRVQHVRLARLLAAHPGLSSVRLERRELRPWESVEFKRAEESGDG